MYANVSLSDEDWLFKQTTYQAEEQGFYETLFALSNGYVGIRHTLDFESPHAVPGAFFARVYGPGLAVSREIVNAPNWLALKLFIDGQPLHLDEARVLGFERILDLKQGMVEVTCRVQDERGRITRLSWMTLLHAQYVHRALLWGTFCAENYRASISLAGYFDYRFGNPYMGGFLPQIQTHHCIPVEIGGPDNLFLEVRTVTGEFHVAQMSQLRVAGKPAQLLLRERDRVAEVVTLDAEAGRPYAFTRHVAFYTSNESDQREADCRAALADSLEQGTSRLVEQHAQAWQARWDHADVRIDGDAKAQHALRFALFHLMQAVDPASHSTNIPARGLTSTYHSGHFFFNTELFKLPYFVFTDPKVARALLQFRYDTLDAAKRHAAEMGLSGARYPEEADDLGQPASPARIVDYFTGDVFWEWSGREVKHLSADVALAIARYVETTGDVAFLLEGGLEMLLETARFGAGLLEWDDTKQAYVVRSVMGLDEYHYHVDNHYYTNYMIRWNLSYALEALDEARRYDPDRTRVVLDRTEHSDAEGARWKALCSQIYLPEHPAAGLIEEFEGYFDLPDQKVERYDANLRPVLSASDAQRASLLENFPTRLLKQADIVMLMALFRHAFSEDVRRANFDFYEPRTAHESSLSAAPHAIVACDIGAVEKAYVFFLQAARYNLDYVPRTAYRNGLHLASYAGAWQAVVEGFAGVCIVDGALHVRPRLPAAWQRVAFKLYWQGQLLHFDIDHEAVKVACVTDRDSGVNGLIYVQEQPVRLGVSTPAVQVAYAASD